MYKVNKSFDHMTTGKSHNRGDKYSFDELTSSQIKYLVDGSFISPIVVKSKKQKATRRVEHEDSSA